MAKTSIADVAEQVQKFWGGMFMKELRESSLLPALVNKDYSGEIKKGGDTVYVSQISAPNGELKTVGVDADSFSPEKLTTTRVAVTADKRAIASFKFEDLVDLQSQIGQENSEIRQALLFGVNKKINTYLYSLVAPSTSAPDHVLNGITDFNAAHLNSLRKLASQAKWDRLKGWYVLVDPSYMSDLLNAATMTSSDYVGNERPVVGGQIAMQRFGFNIFEDNSAGLLQLGTSGEDCALAFHPDFMHLVMQAEPQFKISDLHSNDQFGYNISVDVIFGAKLGIAGNVKHIRTYAT